jgi:hypothetical protein
VIKSLPFLAQIFDPPNLKASLTLFRADVMDSWADNTGNSLLAFPLPNRGCLMTTIFCKALDARVYE